ncbi:MAG: hypothetical protein ABSG34_03825 [Candidatus Sulfotelmatobacter sp.]|jgi:hypothetical protein
MKQLSTVVFILAIFLISSPLPVGAQTAPGAAKTAQTSGYQISEEVTLTGTVSSVLAKSAPGMMVGSHLLLETLSGPVDASLGRFGLMGNGAPSVAVGQQIEVTGNMKMIKDKPVFLVRTLKVGGEVYAVRNKHGFPVSPQARKRAGQSTGRGEASL